MKRKVTEQMLTLNATQIALLPPICFAVLEPEHKAILIKRGEMGYYPMRPEVATDVDPVTYVREANAALGVTEAMVQAMLAGSMFGWHCPAAQPPCNPNN